tara:strand:+ start:6215 stop:6574 length:360 start_codon:yes stop_codon:yes gene_type:complete
MTKLYYGGGNCTIEGSNINVIQIAYRGAIEIDSKLVGNYIIEANNNKIIIAPFGNVEPLNELFEYVGEFKILSIKVLDINAEKVPTTIHRVMDFSELLNTNSEDLTVKSEDLSVTYISK